MFFFNFELFLVKVEYFFLRTYRMIFWIMNLFFACSKFNSIPTIDLFNFCHSSEPERCCRTWNNFIISFKILIFNFLGECHWGIVKDFTFQNIKFCSHRFDSRKWFDYMNFVKFNSRTNWPNINWFQMNRSDKNITQKASLRIYLKPFFVFFLCSFSLVFLTNSILYIIYSIYSMPVSQKQSI